MPTPPYPSSPSRRPGRALLAALLGAAALLAACASSAERAAVDITSDTIADSSATAFPIEIDTAGGPVTIEARPEAIVSMSPTATEMLWAIGAGDQVKAVDSLSTYPAGTPVTDLSAFEPNLEAIAAQQPDLVVLGFANDEIQAGLAGLGIPVLLEEAASTLDDTYSQMTDLGLATGHPDEAAAAVASVRSGIDEVVKGMAATPGARPTVYHELDDTFYSASSGSFIGQLYQLLGYDNIADAADPDGSVGYPQLNAEQIIKANPDLIVITDAYSYGPADIAARPGWNTIKAVADDRVVVVNDDIASRWGPRVVDFLRTIADATPVPAGAAQQ
ncbi:MAG: ABC transporter substrate-binding protein [Acidimicrobiia bacterium]|nr:ABC transporter substrate-binding protein [Acidimicrobiia bacterium]